MFQRVRHLCRHIAAVSGRRVGSSPVHFRCRRLVTTAHSILHTGRLLSRIQFLRNDRQHASVSVHVAATEPFALCRLSSSCIHSVLFAVQLQKSHLSGVVRQRHLLFDWYHDTWNFAWSSQ